MEIEEKKEVSDPSIANVPINFQEPDLFLQYLVSFVNDGFYKSLPITLFVGGNFISGKLISGAEYFDIFKSTLVNKDNAPESNKVLEAFFDEFSSIYKPDKILSNPIINTVYIHLKDVLLYQNNFAKVTINKSVIRMRLLSVDGYLLGSFDLA